VALNPASLARAFVADLTGSETRQGGSTITQQYVKSACLNPKRTLIRNIKEAAIAFRLAHHESKKEILQNYLNTIYWERDAYGVEAASRAYRWWWVAGHDHPESRPARSSLQRHLRAWVQCPDPAHGDPSRRADFDRLSLPAVAL
jgi:hypothetical protein